MTLERAANGWRLASRPGPWIAALFALVAVTLLRSASLLHYSVYMVDEEWVVTIALGFIDFDLNPRWVNYHPLPMYLLGALYYLLYQVYHLLGVVDSKAAYVALLFGREAHLYIPAKLLFSLAYTAGCFVLAWIAFKRSGSRVVAALVAVLCLLAPDGMGAADQIKAESFVFLFLTLTVYFACFAAKRPRSFVLAVVCCAAAFASKVPAIVLFPVLLAVLTADAWRGHYPWRYLGYALLLFPVCVVMFMPYMVIDPAPYKLALERIFDRVSGQRLRVDKLYHFDLVGKWSYLLGLVTRSAGVGGLVSLLGWGVFTAIGKRGQAMAVLFPLAYMTAFSTSVTVEGYWFRPMIPFCFLFAVLWAWELGGHARVVEVMRHAGARVGRQVNSGGVRAVFLAGVTLILIGVPLRGLEVYRQGLTQRDDDTRVIATRWIREHIPAGSTVALDGFLPHLLPKVFTMDAPLLMLTQYGYLDDHFLRNRILMRGYGHYLKQTALRERRYRVMLLGKQIQNEYRLPEGFLKQGAFLVISSAVYDRFYGARLMELSPDMANAAQAFYAAVRTQEHVRTFKGRGPVLEIYRMRHDFPPPPRPASSPGDAP